MPYLRNPPYFVGVNHFSGRSIDLAIVDSVAPALVLFYSLIIQLTGSQILRSKTLKRISKRETYK